MPKSTALDGCLDEMEGGFVEQETTPRLLMKVSIQLHLAGFSLSNTVLVLYIFGIDRARSTIHNWVHKAELQPDSGRTPDHVTIDETVIRLDDERYWLYAVIRTLRVLIGPKIAPRFSNAVDPDSNELLHTKLESIGKNTLVYDFFAKLRETLHRRCHGPRRRCDTVA